MSDSGRSQRINERLFEYWDKIRSGKPYPAEGDIDPSELEGVWDNCFLVKVNEKEHDGFKYSYLGISLIEAYGDDLTGQEICERLVEPNSDPLIKKFVEVRKSGKPVVDENEFKNRKNMLVKYRSCMLPLGTSSGVDYIIGGMKWKAY